MIFHGSSFSCLRDMDQRGVLMLFLAGSEDAAEHCIGRGRLGELTAWWTEARMTVLYCMF